MSCPLDQEALGKLKAFIEICKKNSDILHIPALSFFKEFIESYGGVIPSPKMPTDAEATSAKAQAEPNVTEIDSDPESDLEIDKEGCMEPDELSDIEMGGEIKELSEEETDKAQELRRKAIDLFNEEKFKEAIATYSEAISVDPSSALLFAKRGQAHLKISKPNACIRDCSKALELNPDSAAAYKFRGRAYRLLGEWEKAAMDLRQACKIDFDEQSDEWLKEVTPNAKKIEQHRLKIERKKLEKEEKEKLERLKNIKEARAKAAEENKNQGNIPPPSGMPDMGEFYEMFKDADMLQALKDPDIAAAFKDISENPANILKYQSNPKIMNLLTKLSTKMNFGGKGGMPGFPGAGADFTAPPPKAEFQDDNLD